MGAAVAIAPQGVVEGAVEQLVSFDALLEQFQQRANLLDHIAGLHEVERRQLIERAMHARLLNAEAAAAWAFGADRQAEMAQGLRQQADGWREAATAVRQLIERGRRRRP